MRSFRRLALCGLVLLALTASACGDDDDDDVAASGDDTTETTAAEDGPSAEKGAEAVAFFQSTEEQCAAHAEETSNVVLDHSLFEGATWDEPMSNELGAYVVTDAEGTALIVDLENEAIYGTDGPMGPMPRPYSFSCPEDVYQGTIDDGGQAAGDPCPPAELWFSQGGDQQLAEIEAALHDDPAAGEILDAITFLLDGPEPETADQQAAYEGAVDVLRTNLTEQYGCSLG